MVYVFAILMVAACGLVAALLYFDLSPRAFISKILGRVFGAPQHHRQIMSDAPYRRVRVSANGLHHPALLNLETSEGSGQACHPDVAYIAGGFGPKLWPYWMACTPYPYMDSRFENPELFASYDGLTWSIPDGVQNPLVPPPPLAGDHNSDPDLLFHNNELWLFFRQTLRSKTPRENAIYLMKSSDGRQWSAPQKILNDQNGAELLSPAVIYDGNKFVMWMVEVHGGELKLVCRTSPNALSWSSATSCSVSGLEQGRFPWHLDLIQEDYRLSALLVSCEGLGGVGSRIHYAYSEDQGRSWFVRGFLFDQIYEFEAKLQYRGSLHKDENLGEYQLWYSAASNTNVLSIAYLRVVRTEDDALVPREVFPLRFRESVVKGNK